MTTSVKKCSFELPAMYGDHHVTEVRRLLMEIPGVEDVYASSAFHMVEVGYDPAQVNDLEISIRLDEAGYLGEWSVFAEPAIAGNGGDTNRPAFRHTAAYEQTQQMVSFSQNMQAPGRPLWNCPGMGLIRKMED